jgi:serine/threonine protein kinase
VQWFFEQLFGLADAIKHVHHLKRPGTLMNPTPVDDHCACHHDIKPENILIFEKVDNVNPVFQIADFGAGFIYQADPNEVSRVVRNVRGTKTYFAPEEGRAASRPFDMWSLGCCFLELMLWFFTVFTENGIYEHRFTENRKFFSGHKPTDVSDSFWYKDPEGRIGVLKPVLETIRLLRTSRCREMKVFEDLVDAIWSENGPSLLTIDEKVRMDANKLVDVLSGIRKHLDFEARKQKEAQKLDPTTEAEDIYARYFKRNKRGSRDALTPLLPNALHTLTVTEPQSSKRASLDELRPITPLTESPIQDARPRADSSLLAVGEGTFADILSSTKDDSFINGSKTPRSAYSPDDTIEDGLARL